MMAAITGFPKLPELQVTLAGSPPSFFKSPAVGSISPANLNVDGVTNTAGVAGEILGIYTQQNEVDGFYYFWIYVRGNYAYPNVPFNSLHLAGNGYDITFLKTEVGGWEQYNGTGTYMAWKAAPLPVGTYVLAFT